MPNEVDIYFQPAVSMPEGPAAPSILSTTLRIKVPSILSNRIEWGSVMDSSGLQTTSGGAYIMNTFGGGFIDVYLTVLWEFPSFLLVGDEM